MACVTRDVDVSDEDGGGKPEGTSETDEQPSCDDAVSDFVIDESFDYDSVPLERKF